MSIKRKHKCKPRVESYTNVLYNNNLVLDKNNNVLFYCSDRKFDWYLKRNLIKQIDSDTPRKGIVLFETKGNGYDNNPFLIEKKENKCVVCGAQNKLTRHHVVPYCYRKHLPLEYKTHNFYDVVALCTQCHHDAEKHIYKKNKELEMEINKIVSFQRKKHLLSTTKLLSVLKEHWETIPEYGRNVTLSKLELPIKTLEDLDKVYSELKQELDKYPENYYKFLMSRVDNIESFILDWKKFFIETMSPKHLSPKWDVNFVMKTSENERKTSDH